MVITKKLEWMRDYIDAVAHLLPHLKQLRRISSKSGNKERFQHCHGLITYKDIRHYRITLYINYHDIVTDKIKPYSMMDLLRYLAHELAHLEHWDHTASHTQLECVVLSIFMTKLAQEGYISEEDEDKNGVFYERETE
jgi:hypothetical protein